MRGYGWTVFLFQRNCFEIMIACLFKLDMMAKKNVSILNDEHYISGFFIGCIQKIYTPKALGLSAEFLHFEHFL